MSSTQSILTCLCKLSQPSFVSIAEGCACLVVGHGKTNLTSSPQISQALYIPNFPIYLLSINVITKALFSPSHSFFTIQDLQMRKRIGLTCETKRGLYELVPNHLLAGLSGLLSSTDIIL